MPGHQLQQRALAGSVPADHPERPALRNRQRDIVQCGERLVGPEIPDQAARQQRAFQRRELLTMAEPAVKLRGAIDFDREGRGARGDERGARGEVRGPKVRGSRVAGRSSSCPCPLLAIFAFAPRTPPLAPRSSVTLPPQTSHASGRRSSSRAETTRLKPRQERPATSSVRTGRGRTGFPDRRSPDGRTGSDS